MRKSIDTLRQEFAAAKSALALAIAEDVRVGSEYVLPVRVVAVDPEIGRARIASENETLMWVDCSLLRIPADTRSAVATGNTSLRIGQLVQVTQYGMVRAVDTRDNTVEVRFTLGGDCEGRVVRLGIDSNIWFDAALVNVVSV